MPQINHESLPGAGQTVCVTGAGGFIASWVVKLLLERGYTVKGTVRNPVDRKNDHLSEFPGAKEMLTLCQANLLDFHSLREAIKGCDGVFHTATPTMSNNPDMVGPAWKGTRNVMITAAEAKCRRVVFTSSIGALYMNPNRHPDIVVDELERPGILQENKELVLLREDVVGANGFAREKGVDLVVVIPCVVIGPFLQPTINASIQHILKYLSGSAKTYTNLVQAYVHVFDAAMVHIMVFENPSASGRYLCAETILHSGEVVEILDKLFPGYPVPTKCSDEVSPRVKPYTFSTRKLKALGMEFIPVEQSLDQTVKTLQQKGHLLPESFTLMPDVY